MSLHILLQLLQFKQVKDKMKKIAIIFMAVALATNFCACKKTDGTNENVPVVVTVSPEDNEAYHRVCDKHILKMKKKVPQLVKEYKEGAAEIIDKGYSKKKREKKLEELYMVTLSKLAKINAKGVSAMADVKNSASNEVGFQDWTKTLYNTYSDQAAKISKAYHKSLK